MQFVIDVDGTIGEDAQGLLYAQALNEQLNLQINQQTLDEIGSYQEFRQLPRVQIFLQEPAQAERYHSVYQTLQHNPLIQSQLSPLPGAQEGVQRLVQLGRIVYATCRNSDAGERTQNWLRIHDFPAPEQAVMCHHYYYKYLVAFDQAEPGEGVVLIDNSEAVIKAFARVIMEYRDVASSLLRRLTIAAFGYQESPAPGQIPLRVFPLPSWEPEALQALERRMVLSTPTR